MENLGLPNVLGEALQLNIFWPKTLIYSRSWRGVPCALQLGEGLTSEMSCWNLQDDQKVGAIFWIMVSSDFWAPGGQKGVKRGSKLPFSDKIITGD